jgi:hypothetical protein
MLNVIQGFGKHCRCHLQGEHVGWAFLEVLGQAVGGHKLKRLDLTFFSGTLST